MGYMTDQLEVEACLVKLADAVHQAATDLTVAIRFAMDHGLEVRIEVDKDPYLSVFAKVSLEL